MSKVAVKLKYASALSAADVDALPPGQAHWWLRKESEFVRLPRRVRGNETLDLVVQLEPGRYVVGVGPARSGVRVEFEVKPELAKGTVDDGKKVVTHGPRLDLTGKTIVITGDLAGLDRDAAKAWLVGLGAKVTSAVSKNTDYLIVGTEPGQKKLEKAAELGTTVIGEADLRAQLGGDAPPAAAPATVAKPVEPAKIDKVGKMILKIANVDDVIAKVEKLIGVNHFADLGRYEDELWGVAIGERGGQYNVYINLNDRPNWALKCNCRSRKPCKHGYALLFTADRFFVPPVPAPTGHEEASRYVPGWE